MFITPTLVFKTSEHISLAQQINENKLYHLHSKHTKSLITKTINRKLLNPRLRILLPQTLHITSNLQSILFLQFPIFNTSFRLFQFRI